MVSMLKYNYVYNTARYRYRENNFYIFRLVIYFNLYQFYNTTYKYNLISKKYKNKNKTIK